MVDGTELRGPLKWNGARLDDERRLSATQSGFLIGSFVGSFNGELLCDVTSSCTPIVPVGVDGDGYWTFDGSQTFSSRTELRAAGSLFIVPFRTAVDPLTFPVHGSFTPRLHPNVGHDELLTIARGVSGPVLERWPATAKLTRDFVFVDTTATSVTWIRR